MLENDYWLDETSDVRLVHRLAIYAEGMKAGRGDKDEGAKK